MTHKKDEYDWFGIEPKKRKKQPSVSFLGLGGTPKKKNINSKVSFLGNANPSFSLKSPSKLFVKERLSTKKKRLSKWGDVDMDGSPNYFDCDPRNFLKDAKPLNKSIVRRIFLEPIGKDKDMTNRKGKIVRNEYGEPLVKESRGKRLGEYLAQRAKGSESRNAMAEAVRAEKNARTFEVSVAKERYRAKKEIRDAERLIKEKEKRGEPVSKKEQREIEQLKTEYRSESKRLDKKVKQANTLAEAKTQSSNKFAALEKVALLTGPAKAAASFKVNIDNALASGKTPTKKDIFAYQEALKKTSIEARAGRLGEALGAGSAMGIASGSGLMKTSKGLSYNKEMLAKSARMKRLTVGAAGLLFGPSLAVKGGFASEPRGRGRPAGPSGEYKIGGKPVYEEEFQQWKAKQNALNRMLPSEAQSQTLNPEYVAYMKAQEEQRNQKAQMQSEMDQSRFQQPEFQQQQDMIEGTEGNMTEPVPSDQAPQTEGLTNEAVQAIEEAKRRPYTRASYDEIKQAQQMAQQQDQILKAPNFMKGELKAAGGGILTPQGPQIMDAPNAFKGEMRNVYKQSSDLGEVKLTERPQTNPYGDEYLEIELGSGKPVVRKRIREKWMTGEAL